MFPATRILPSLLIGPSKSALLKTWLGQTHTRTRAHMHKVEHKQAGDLIGWRQLCVLYITPYPSHRWLGKGVRCCGNTKQRAGATYGAMMWGDCQWWRVIHVWLPLCNWGRERWRERTEGVWGESWTFSVSCCNLCITLSIYIESFVAAQNHNINIDHWPLIFYLLLKMEKILFQRRAPHCALIWHSPSLPPSPPLSLTLSPLSLTNTSITDLSERSSSALCTLWT